MCACSISAEEVRTSLLASLRLQICHRGTSVSLTPETVEAKLVASVCKFRHGKPAGFPTPSQFESHHRINKTNPLLAVVL